MTKKFSFFALAVALVAGTAQVNADSISFATPEVRKVTAAESANAGGPVDGDVYTFKVTTDGDILSINTIKVTLDGGATLYNNTFGDASDSAPGNPALIPAFPSLAVDSWITTPGTTSLLGAKLPGDGVDTTYGDLSNDGAQSGFTFAQLTVPSGATGLFTGFVSIAGGGGTTVYSQPFSLSIGEQIPEPASVALAGMALVGLVAARRRNA